MTNFEKYRDKLMAISIKGRRVALVKQQPVDCHNISCTACDLYCEVPCDVERLKWLCEEYKEPAPKLTLEERHFCEVVNHYSDRRITRPMGSSYTCLIEDKVVRLNINSQWFKFIKGGENWSISDLLKLEVKK